MKNSTIKRIVRATLLRDGTVTWIASGPMKGMRFRVSNVTGLSPLYSGAEPDHQGAFKRLVGPGSVVMDIGANWGLHTLYLSRLVGSSGQVLAAECNPDVYAELQFHLHLNHCGNVLPLQVAVADIEGASNFLFGDSASTGQLESAASNLAGRPRSVKVATNTIDNLVRSIGLKRLDLVKVDVEGAESAVLQGAKRVTEELQPIFVIDLHSPLQDVDVARWLTERGYRVERLAGPPIKRLDVGYPNSEGVWGTILAYPPSSANR